MQIMIDIFHGISSNNKDYRDGWHAHQYQKLKLIYPDIKVDHYCKRLDEATTVFIDPGIEFILNGEFECLGGFMPEHYYTIQKLKTKKTFWIGKNCNDELNTVLRSFKARDYHLRDIIGSKIDTSPVNFKVHTFKFENTIVGNVHCLCYANKDDKIIIVNETLEELLADGLMYEDATYCFGNGESLDVDMAEEYVKQVAAMNGKICQLLPFNDNEFNEAITAYADDYLVEIIETPKPWYSIPHVRWDAEFLDEFGFIKPTKYNINGITNNWRFLNGKK